MIIDRSLLTLKSIQPSRFSIYESVVYLQISAELESAYDDMVSEINRCNSKAEHMIMIEGYGGIPLYDYLILNEGAKDAIMKFLKTASGAIQKAWSAFKEKRVGDEIRQLINDNKQFLNSAFKMLMPKDYEIPNLKTWDHYYTTITVKDFSSNYDSWKQNNTLESVEEFIKSQYPELVDGDKHPEEILHEKIFHKVNANEAMTSDTIAPYSDFLLNQYGKQVEIISKDVDSFNAAAKNIEERLNQISENATEYIGNKMLYMVFEDGENKSSDNKDEENNDDKFRDASDPDGKKEKKDNSLDKDRKNILVYYKASSKIFSAKLKTCEEIRATSQKLIQNFVKLQQKKAKNGEKEKEKTSNTPESTPEIK